jgi:hypothetical protein
MSLTDDGFARLDAVESALIDPRLTPPDSALFSAALHADCSDLACLSSLMADSTVDSEASAIC